MKKQIIAIALISGLTMATAASANWGRGGHGSDSDCYCLQSEGPMMREQMMGLDQATPEKVRKFFKDNQALHKQIVMKQAEKRATMQSEKPDPQDAAKVTGELFDLQIAMHEKAETAGVSKYLGHKNGDQKGRRPGSVMDGGPGMGMNGPKQ